MGYSSKPIKYIAESERDHKWGLTVCSVGYQSVRPGEHYPPRGHEHEYMFNVNRGRVIHEYQLLYIARGRGVLRTASCDSIKITEGMMFLIFPDEWHTYHPDPETGWDEYWIGFSGANIESRVKEGFFSRRQPAYKVGRSFRITSLYQDAINTATDQPLLFQQVLAGIVNLLLGIMVMSHANNILPHGPKESILAARDYMLDHVGEHLSMPEVAAHVNMAYSTFRRYFSEFMDMTPAAYFLSLKIAEAKKLLKSTDMSVKMISYRLNFESPEYFSTIFKRTTGQSPRAFRETI